VRDAKPNTSAGLTQVWAILLPSSVNAFGHPFLATVSNPGPVVRFDSFELDLRSGELRQNGASVKLQPQPAKVLALLVGRAGQVVSREELVGEVWGSQTFVDYEHGLNFAIRQIRSALGDDADQPRFSRRCRGGATALLLRSGKSYRCRS